MTPIKDVSRYDNNASLDIVIVQVLRFLLTHHPLPPTDLHILQQIRKASPHLLSTRHNLLRGQHKAKIARVPQLDRHRKGRLGIFKRIIHAISANLVNGAANRTTSERRPMHSLHSCYCALR